MKEIVEQINELSWKLQPLKEKIDLHVKNVAVICAREYSRKFPCCVGPSNTDQIIHWEIEDNTVIYFWENIDDRGQYDTFPSYFVYDNEALELYINDCYQIEQERKNLEEAKRRLSDIEQFNELKKKLGM